MDGESGDDDKDGLLAYVKWNNVKEMIEMLYARRKCLWLWEFCFFNHWQNFAQLMDAHTQW